MMFLRYVCIALFMHFVSSLVRPFLSYVFSSGFMYLVIYLCRSLCPSVLLSMWFVRSCFFLSAVRYCVISLFRHRFLSFFSSFARSLFRSLCLYVCICSLFLPLVI